MQASPRIAILGPGGIGKTSLAIAVLHKAEVAEKYPQKYFILCHSSRGRAELLANIVAHIGLERGASASRVIQYFSASPPTLLILDNFETTWEIRESRPEVENFLSLLADVPQLAIMVRLT
jgi:GTPase SAR1 family protein